MIQHRDGVPWWDAPPPPRRHEHTPQTWGSAGSIALLERCACGAARLDGGGPWFFATEREERTARVRQPWFKRWRVDVVEPSKNGTQ